MKRYHVIVGLVLISTAAFAQSAKELTQKGRELYEKNEFMEALLNLNKAIAIDANYAPAYYLRGNIKDNFEDRHGAMKDYNTAVEKNPKFADAFFARGNVKMKLRIIMVQLLTTLQQLQSMRIISKRTLTGARQNNFYWLTRMLSMIVQKSFR